MMDSKYLDTEAEYLDLPTDAIWSNEATIEFLQLLQTEPAIWDPNHKYNKNRIRKHDAWLRVKENFSLLCTLEELKKKRNSLMTTYRENLKKLRDSAKSSSDDEDIVFKPSWFAFEVMHNYLSPVYNCSPAKEESRVRRRRLSSLHLDSYLISVDTKSELSESRGSIQSGVDPLTDDYEMSTKRWKAQQTGHYMLEENLNRVGNVNNECDLYGQLLAEKLKQMQEDDRLTLMNEIDNLVFKYKMTIIKDS